MLRGSSQISEADWLEARMAPFASGVGAIVPEGFPAYVRILHPASGPADRPVRWSEVAATTGRIMHRLAQFHAINRPPATISGSEVYPPRPGDLPPDLLSILCAALAQHTSTPESCYFCSWVGYGWLDHNQPGSTVAFTPKEWSGTYLVAATATHSLALSPAMRAAAGEAGRIELPWREYLLFEGPVAAATELGWLSFGESFDPKSPNLFWPKDHAWCVGTEVDLSCTFVGGSEELAERLLADPRLEAWRVFADDPITWDSDDRNPLD